MVLPESPWVIKTEPANSWAACAGPVLGGGLSAAGCIRGVLLIERSDGGAGAGHDIVRDDSGDQRAVARSASGTEDRGEARGAVAGARRDPMAVPGVRRRSGRLRPRRGTDLAPSGHLPVRDASACGDSAGAVSDARCEASASALGRTAQSLHAVDGATDHRPDPAVQYGQGRVRDCGGQLGRSLGRDEPGGGPGASAQRGAAHPLHWRR